MELRLILDGHPEQQRRVDPALLKALARARSWFEEVALGRVGSLAEIARREGVRKRYVARFDQARVHGAVTGRGNSRRPHTNRR